MDYAATTTTEANFPAGTTSVTESLDSPAPAAVITTAVQKATVTRKMNPQTRGLSLPRNRAIKPERTVLTATTTAKTAVVAPTALWLEVGFISVRQ